MPVILDETIKLANAGKDRGQIAIYLPQFANTDDH